MKLEETPKIAKKAKLIYAASTASECSKLSVKSEMETSTIDQNSSAGNNNQKREVEKKKRGRPKKLPTLPSSIDTSDWTDEMVSFFIALPILYDI